MFQEWSLIAGPPSQSLRVGSTTPYYFRRLLHTNRHSILPVQVARCRKSRELPELVASWLHCQITSCSAGGQSLSGDVRTCCAAGIVTAVVVL